MLYSFTATNAATSTAFSNSTILLGISIWGLDSTLETVCCLGAATGVTDCGFESCGAGTDEVTSGPFVAEDFGVLVVVYANGFGASGSKI